MTDKQFFNNVEYMLLYFAMRNVMSITEIWELATKFDEMKSKVKKLEDLLLDMEWYND